MSPMMKRIVYSHGQLSTSCARLDACYTWLAVCIALVSTNVQGSCARVRVRVWDS